MSITAVPLRPIRKGSVMKLWLGLALLLLVAVGAAWAGTARYIYQTTPSGLQYRVLKEGEGPRATASDVVFVQYTGRLENGQVFDSNAGQQPVPMPASDGAMIKGFTEGLRLMRKGGVYRLRLPPRLAYGERGMPPTIPANSALEFDVAALEVIPEATMRAMMQQQMLQQQMQQGGAGGPGGPGSDAPVPPGGR
ncbi:MAG: FKBP-type peptidyl-prolyl cis-trans isomerase [Alphaproteobacteria bacterium]|nr:FKBP-type peptidyl-prolyl cis-trans isomerase [Alphaproteobacteria bacterium]MBV9370862.1 FKBP-type peptidyl-prolyl cis-trans isomerase [Alphaproteobacteria bacterium]MBV9902105.1 FKBP-type peptidyl-prolyl cis-trans isomerase [Alphaproteobacteria bacterium]